MSNERFANVWDAIEDTPAQAENMRLRASLMLALRDHIEREGLTQSQAAKRLAVTQPRISDLMRGKIDLFAIDTLVNMLASAGLDVELRIGTAPVRRKQVARPARRSTSSTTTRAARRSGAPPQPTKAARRTVVA